MFTKGGHKLYRLTWNCQIVKSSVADANTEAKSKVENEIKISGKEKEANQGNYHVPAGFTKDAYDGSVKEGFWYNKDRSLASVFKVLYNIQICL